MTEPKKPKHKFKDPVTDKITCLYGVEGSMWAAGHHTGVDYGCKIGTDVRAVADGVVVASNWGEAYGVHVIVQHFQYRFIYAHLNSKAPIVPGTPIKQGTILGKSGASGNVAGPHLHLEARTSPFRYGLDAVEPRTCLR